MRVVTVAGDPEREAQLAAQLDPRSDVELVLRCVDRVEALGCIRGASLDAVIVVGDPVWFDVQCSEETASHNTKLIALAPDPLAAERMRSFGACVLTVEATVEQVIDACVEAPPSTGPTASEAAVRGSLVAVWGPKGAPGRSTIALELATELAASEPDTLLIDGDTYGGDLLQMTGVVEEVSTIVWAARLASKHALDPTSFGQGVRRVAPTGPVLLPGIPRADLWPEITDHGWKAMLQAAREAFRFIVCDVGFGLEADASPYPESGEGRNRVGRTTLRSADHVVAVVRSDPVGIKNFLWAFEQLKDLIDERKILIVANKVHAGDEREVADVLKRYTRKRPLVMIPDDPVRVVGAMAELAAAIGARVRQRGFLTRLGGRS